MAARTTTINDNVYNTTQLIINTMGVIFRNALVLTRPGNCRRGLSKNLSGKYPVGETFQMRNPQRKRGYAGRKPVIEEHESPTVSLIIDNQRGVAYQYISWEDRFFRLDEAIAEMAPNMNALTNKIDYSGSAGNVSPPEDTADNTRTFLDVTDTSFTSTGVENGVYAFGEAGKKFGDGTGDQDPMRVFMEAGARLQSLGVHSTRNVFLPPLMNGEAAISFRNTFNPQMRVSKFFDTARIEGTKPTFGLDKFETTQNIKQHQVGKLTGVGASGLQVDVAPADGAAQVTLKGVTAGTVAALRKGDIIGYRDGAADIPAVNFTETDMSVSSRFEQVVLEDAPAATGGKFTVKVFPPFAAGTGSTTRGDSAKRNKRMARLPKANNTLYVCGKLIDDAAAASAIGDKTIETGYIFTPNALALMFSRWKLPKSSEDAHAVEVPNEFYAATDKYYNSELQRWTCRTDSWWGGQVVRNEECGVVFGKVIG